ncbi:MAG: VWA domain-containing protein [Phycisphaerales bacterium]|nr:VWA domain-containing protein [Phycisphaerales bacterium]
MRTLRSRFHAAVAGATLLIAQFGHAQSYSTAPADCVVVPACRCFHPTPRPMPERVRLTSVKAAVEIADQVATTTLTLTLENPWHQPQQSEVLVPLPGDAVVRSFGYDGASGETTARLLPRDEARRLYDAIVAKSRDPGLLEFAGTNAIRSSTFPVPAKSTQRVWVTYEQVLKAESDRYDYVLPRSESIQGVRLPWSITVNVRAKSTIATVYSPSHMIDVAVGGPNHRTVNLAPRAETTPGSFRLSILHGQDGLANSLIAYPAFGGEDGYFLLLTGVPAGVARAHADRPAMRREVILVLDRSGSMRGEKFEQARSAATQVIEGLSPGELFNIIDYSNTIAAFAEKPIAKDAKTLADARAYLAGLKADGGTNIHDALLHAMAQPHDAEALPMVLFLTDGLPTVGNTSEVEIRGHAAEANKHKRRIFTFGVGYDLNAPLLDRIASMGRGASTNVLPNENIEVAVSKVFQRLVGPVLEFPKIAALDDRGEIDTRVIYDVMPVELPDLFDGDQLIVLGRYRGDGPLALRLTGQHAGVEKTTMMKFALDKASVANGHVPRLWASRRIGFLVDEIRQRGGAGGNVPVNKELVDEIVRLSTKFGIMTEYTSFLTTDSGSAVAAAPTIDRDAAVGLAMDNVARRAVTVRGGAGAVNQSMNIKAQQAQSCANADNRYYDEEMREVTVNSVQQVCDQTLFRRGDRWIDSRLMMGPDAEAKVEPQRTVEFGTPEYFDLAQQLAVEGRSALISISGEVYIQVGTERVLVKNPKIDEGC